MCITSIENVRVMDQINCKVLPLIVFIQFKFGMFLFRHLFKKKKHLQRFLHIRENKLQLFRDKIRKHPNST